MHLLFGVRHLEDLLRSFEELSILLFFIVRVDWWNKKHLDLDPDDENAYIN
jgi:hypothetical protein